MLRVSRRLEYADRFGRQQADQSIKRNVVRALVELITNSDDSYNRLEEKGQDVSGKIIVEVLRRHSNSELRVADSAEGMDESSLDKGLGTYGEDVSGFSSGAAVRGYFGRGLKDAILGLGHGEITTIKNSQIQSARLVFKGSGAHYEAESPRPVTDDDRRTTGVSSENGTIVHITLSREDVRMPQFDTLRRQLSLYYSLRNILASTRRQLLLREIEPRGPRVELQLAYKMPKGLQVLANASHDLDYRGARLPFQLILMRSEVPLNTPGEEGPVAQGGLLMCGKHAIFDNSLFKFDGSEAARRFLGRVVCPYFDELLRANEPILKATRDGLDWEHEFNRVLKKEIENLLEPFIRQEEDKARVKETRARSAKLQRKLSDALDALNRIAQHELEVEKPVGPPPPKEPFVPDSGFGFVPEFSHVVSGKEGTLLLRALTNIVSPGTTARVTSDNPEVVVLTPQVSLEERAGFNWLAEAKIRIEGGQVNNQGVVSADSDGLRAEALVEVVARQEPSPPPPPPRRRGLFSDIIFDSTAEPPQRVRFDRTTGNIVVYTAAPSVKPYVDPRTLEIDDSAQGQVMLAELVLEASCSEIIRRNVASGRVPLPGGTEAEALENAYRRFRQDYAAVVHGVLVDSEYRR